MMKKMYNLYNVEVVVFGEEQKKRQSRRVAVLHDKINKLYQNKNK